MTEAQFAIFHEILKLKEEAAEQAALILNRLMEELPLRKLVKRAVRRGEASPNLYRELFGEGEGSGWSKADNRNLECVLNVFFATDKLADSLLEAARENPISPAPTEG